ncbi:MAG: hypothetical protein KGQ46_13940 [Hyphomicrobiales bacterium]|nr:hypothetical protein [Hyphomicrobiales bacterium]MDE2115806.1 hypothetical protein [Hyphomicrobiales bacterium]
MSNLKLLSGLVGVLIATMILSTLTIVGAIRTQRQTTVASGVFSPANSAGATTSANSGTNAPAASDESLTELRAIRADQDKAIDSLAQILKYLNALDLPTKTDRAAVGHALGMPTVIVPGMPQR